MKKILICIVLIVAAVLSAAVNCYAENAAAEQAEPETAEWTVLVYLCGSDLESKYSYATYNLQEMAGVEFPYNYLPLFTEEITAPEDIIRDIGKVNVLIETGGAAKWHASELGMDVSTDVLQRWRLNYDPREEHTTQDPIEFLESLPLQSMGDPGTLTDFIRWGAGNYPAKKYALVLWGHGNGAISGVCIDELFDNDSLQLYELNQALANSGEYLETVVIDACLMANLETASALKNYARWMVASQENVPGKGTAVGNWLQALVNHPALDGEWLGRNVCDTTGVKYANEADDMAKSLLTWAVIDLSGIDRVLNIFDRFFQNLGDTICSNPNVAQIFAQHIFNTSEFGDGNENMRDLGDLFYSESLIHYLDSDFLDEAVTALSKTVVYLTRGTGRSNAHGLSYCYPADFLPEELDIYARNFHLPSYLAFLDASSEWSAPDWVYADAEKLPSIDTIEALQVSIEKKLTENGMPALSFGLTEDNMGYLYYNLYRLNEETGEIERLGRTDCVPEPTAEGTVWKPENPMTWPGVDGVPCCIDLIQFSDLLRLYNIPVQINTDTAIPRCGRTIEYSDDGSTGFSSYEVYGVWEGYEENSSLMERSVKPLDMLFGRNFKLLYPKDETGNSGKTSYGQSDEMTFYRSLIVEDFTLPAGTYYLEFELWDIFMRTMRTEKIPLYWNGEEMSFGDGFTWEGFIQPSWNH
ncbi:MAG: hypothetical protein IKG23_08810 [Clostridia bacterium]|nr:hypothetical protein [Clostridia bacterium]